jgi:hypothetical protein
MSTRSLVLCLTLASLVACGGGRRHRADPPPPAPEPAPAPAPEPAPPPPAERAEARPLEARPSERRDDRQDRRVEASTRWEKLGERKVHGKADRDVIAVGRQDGTFATIKLVVEHSALEMWDVKVTFGDGEVFSPSTRLAFGKNSTSREIDLPGQRRVIKRVDFKYGNLPGNGRAQIELWAR